MSRWVTSSTIGLFAGMGLAAWTGERAVMLLLLAAVGIIIVRSLFPDRRKTFFSFIGLLALSSGIFFYQQAFDRWQRLPETIGFSGAVEIVERGEVKVFYRPVTLRPLDEDWYGGDILYRAPIDMAALPGEEVAFECMLSRPKNFEPGFDYRSLLASRGVGYACDRAGTAELLPSTGFSLRKLFATIQSGFRRAIADIVPEPEAGLLSGLLVGGSDTLAPETKAAFAQAGLSHIVAVSGYNMSIVAEGLVVFSLIFGAWRKWAVAVAIIGLAFFLLVIDGSAASLRAALMAWLAFGAYFFGRPAASWNGLMIAGAGMLFFNPLLIRYDVGFQLSFLATLALLIFSRSFETFAFFRQWYGKVAALFLTTIVIELFTLPIVVSTFGTFSVVAPFANALVLPLVPIAMFIGIGAVVLSGLVPALGIFITPLVWLPLTAIIRLAEGLARIPGASLEGLDMPASFALLWYAGLAATVLLLEYFRKRYVLGMDH